jgi:hypothetical protein
MEKFQTLCFSLFVKEGSHVLLKNDDVQWINPLGHHGEVFNKAFCHQCVGAS